MVWSLYDLAPLFLETAAKPRTHTLCAGCMAAGLVLALYTEDPAAYTARMLAFGGAGAMLAVLQALPLETRVFLTSLGPVRAVQYTVHPGALLGMPYRHQFKQVRSSAAREHECSWCGMFVRSTRLSLVWALPTPPHAHARTHARTHTRTHARTHARTHTSARIGRRGGRERPQQ
jgi:hypothetical protein